jgi:uncharacterized OsmC-like protein
MADPSTAAADARSTPPAVAAAAHPPDPPVHLRLRSRNRWASGQHSRSVTQPFQVRRREHDHARSFVFESDYPEVLGGAGNGPIPAEYLLYGLAGSIAASLASVARERGVHLRRITSVIEGELDLRGVSGAVPDVAAGFQWIHVELTVDADVPRVALEQLVSLARARASVLDTLTRAVPVRIGLRRYDEEASDVRDETAGDRSDRGARP